MYVLTCTATTYPLQLNPEHLSEEALKQNQERVKQLFAQLLDKIFSTNERLPRWESQSLLHFMTNS